MNQSTTSDALMPAIASMSTTFSGPRSTNATAVVTAVSTISTAKIPTYTRGGTTCVCASAISVPPDQVEEREEEDPDDVDEVPVEAAHLDRRRVRGPEAAAARREDEPGEDAEP